MSVLSDKVKTSTPDSRAGEPRRSDLRWVRDMALSFLSGGLIVGCVMWQMWPAPAPPKAAPREVAATNTTNGAARPATAQSPEDALRSSMAQFDEIERINAMNRARSTPRMPGPMAPGPESVGQPDPFRPSPRSDVHGLPVPGVPGRPASDPNW